VAERRPPGPPDLLRRGTADHYEDPELYDFEYRDHRHDIRWYRDLARALGAGLEILELGAGTGRISLPLAADGHRVTAVDRMPAMLDRLQAKLAQQPAVGHRVEPVLGDITAIPLPDASFDLVIAPFNVLMHLYRWQDLLACFREARRVLVPGGTFALDVLLPDLEWLGWDQEERHSVTYFTHPRTGASMVYSTNHTYDPDTQVCHVRIYYDDAPKRPRAFKPPPVPVQVVHLAHRQIFPEELRLLIASAGFDLVSHTADFRAGALKKESEAQVVVARKPGDPTPITE
jgi:ubiquinone/menaquinone biosynthesis C-methylase UbiE